MNAGTRWPTPFAGQINNNVYLAQMDIVLTEGEPTQWHWRFFIDSPDVAAAPAPNTACINRIWVQAATSSTSRSTALRRSSPASTFISFRELVA